MKKVRAIICVLLALSVMYTLFACSGDKAGDTSAGTSGDTGQAAAQTGGSPAQQQNAEDKFVSLVVASAGGTGIFLPGVSPTESKAACSAVFDTVFYYDAQKGEFYSNILSDWHFDGSMTLLMKLKPGVIFSNGDEATPEDLLFSFLSNRERGSAWFSMIPMDWDNCVLLDDGTVQIKVMAPYPPLLEQPVYLISEAWSRSVGWDSLEWYYPVGSGPYYCYDYLTDSHITLRLRDDYWNAANTNFTVDEWILKNYPDANTLAMDFEQGNIDLTRLMIQSYDRFMREGGKGIDCLLKDMGTITFFFMSNGSNPIFNDIAVRKAIAHACDWEQLGYQRMGESMYLPANSFAVPGTEFNNPDVEIYKYDPDYAKSVLADAGYAPGDVVFDVYAMEGEGYKNFLEAMQYYLDQVGIKMNVEFGDVSSALARWVIPGGTDAGVLENGNGSLTRDPFSNLDRYTLGFLFTFWNDDEVQGKIAEALFCPDRALQIKLYKDLQQYMHDNYICMPISLCTYVMGYKTDVFNAKDVDLYVYTESYCDLMMLGQVAH